MSAHPGGENGLYSQLFGIPPSLRIQCRPDIGVSLHVTWLTTRKEGDLALQRKGPLSRSRAHNARRYGLGRSGQFRLMYLRLERAIQEERETRMAQEEANCVSKVDERRAARLIAKEKSDARRARQRGVEQVVRTAAPKSQADFRAALTGVGAFPAYVSPRNTGVLPVPRPSYSGPSSTTPGPSRPSPNQREVFRGQQPRACEHVWDLLLQKCIVCSARRPAKTASTPPFGGSKTTASHEGSKWCPRCGSRRGLIDLTCFVCGYRY